MSSNVMQDEDAGICKVSTTKTKNTLPVLETLWSYLASLATPATKEAHSKNTVSHKDIKIRRPAVIKVSVKDIPRVDIRGANDTLLPCNLEIILMKGFKQDVGT